MTKVELSAQAANLQRAIGSAATCSSATVESLKALLLPEPLPQTQPKLLKSRLNGVPSNSSAKNATASRHARQNKIAICEDHEQRQEVFITEERQILATNVVNQCLKALTDAAQKKTCQTPSQSKRRSLARCSSDSSLSRCSTPRCQTPLRPVSGNQNITPRNREAKGLSTKGESADNDGLRAQARCAQISFACLRATQNKEKPNQGHSVPRLEMGMSALIHKLIALEFYGLAIRELKILKARLFSFSDPSNKPVKSRLGRPQMNPKEETASSRESLTTLLDFRGLDCRGPVMGVVVTSQIQTLRIITNLGLEGPECLLEQLSFEKANTLAQLILNQVDDVRTETRNKAAQQLEVVAQMVLKISSVRPPSRKSSKTQIHSLGPEIVLQLQTAAFVVRSKSWELSGHKIDAVKDVFGPLARFLESFRTDSRATAAEQYQSVRNTFNAFTDSVYPCYNSSHEMLQVIYQTLADVAQAAGQTKDALAWMQKAINCPSGGPSTSIKQCLMTCKMLTYHFRDESREKESLALLKAATALLSSNLQGDSADLDELLVTVASLRKSIASALTNNARRNETIEAQLCAESATECLGLLSLCVNFIVRYLGSPPSLDDNEKARLRYQHRMKLVLAIAASTVETTSTVARLYSRSESGDWKTIEASLDDCFQLAKNVGELKIEHGKSSPYLTIANAHWCRFLQLKRNDAELGQQRHCLRACVDIARSLPGQHTIWLLPKLEQYGHLYENARDLSSALNAYAEAIQAHINLGTVAKAAAATSTRSLAAAFEGDENIKSLARVLQAHVRVASKLDCSETGETIYYDSQELPADQRLSLLSYQFATMTSRLHSRGPTVSLQQAMRRLSNRLLSICTGDGHTIQRIHILVQMLYTSINHPAAIASPSLSCALEQTVGISHHPVNGMSNLQSFLPHLSDSLRFLVAVRQGRPDLGVIEDVLKAWAELVRQISDYHSLQTLVYDVESWQLHLELAVEYLEFQGLHALRCLALYICSAIWKLPGVPQVSGGTTKLIQLGCQYVRLGHTALAETSLRKAHQSLEEQAQSLEIKTQWRLAAAELALETDNYISCGDHLQAVRTNLSLFDMGVEGRQHGIDRTHVYNLTADTDLLQARLAEAQGRAEESLLFARLAIKGFHQIWSILERRQARQAIEYNVGSEESTDESLTTAFSELSTSPQPCNHEKSPRHLILRSAAFWALVPRLLNGLWFLSSRFAHAGLFAETDYYLAEAQKIAQAVSAPVLLKQQAYFQGQCYQLSSTVTKSLPPPSYCNEDVFGDAGSHEMFLIRPQLTALGADLSKDFHQEGTLDLALQRVREMRKRSYVDHTLHGKSALEGMVEQLGNTSIQESETTTSKPKRQARGHTSNPKANTIKANGPSKKVLPSVVELPDDEVVPLCRSEGELQIRKASLALTRGDLELASREIGEINGRRTGQRTAISCAVIQAEINMKRGFEELFSHPVLSVVRESTISYPCVNLSTRGSGIHATPSTTQRQGRAMKQQPSKALAKKTPAKSTELQWKHAQLLRAAQKDITDVLKLAKRTSSTHDLHHMLDLLSRSMLTLTTLNPPTPNISVSAVFLTFAAELGRMVSMLQGALAIRVERQILSQNKTRLMVANDTAEEEFFSSAMEQLSLSNFEADYVDIIPKAWDAISMTLSESQEEILITKMRVHQNPFVLRIPLKRQDVLDSDETSFGFEEAQCELREIIDFANTSSQDAKSQTGKAAKKEWWTTRSELDTRIYDLLQNIDNVWFGGFRGVFSQHIPGAELLARFQQSLQVSLEKHLPSRQKSSKNKPAEHIALAPQVLELFVALGFPDETNDVDEQVLDLLYYVVDILQFNGERNAYDEIDFDSIVIETHDALRHYHQAARQEENHDQTRHTILILDKHLHGFPWESLPCMKGQSISRLPSLSCLRQRILQQRAQQAELSNLVSTDNGLRITRQNGAFILNPAGDLTHTQNAFEEKLQSLPGWEGITQRAPEEADFSSYLSDHALFLYFGHGSGGQYIRARTIKKLDTCAVSLLMGCSSGALTECGKFEPYGTPINYMHAGCPALLANLWDVTDKDIDRFAMSVLEGWGLFEKEGQPLTSAAMKGSPVKRAVKGRGKGKAREMLPIDEKEGGKKGKMSLDEAVAKGRDACVLKYLNGAAPVIYGIPVFLD